MNYATTKQIGAIHALLAKKGLMDDKRAIMFEASGGRTDSTKLLTTTEAFKLLSTLNGAPPKPQANALMLRKLFAMAHEMGWVQKRRYVAPSGEMMEDNDYKQLHDWVLKYGYAKKELRKYSYTELPKLLSQFEFGPYKHYISNLNKKP